MGESCLWRSVAAGAAAHRRTPVYGRSTEVAALVQALDPSGSRRVSVHGPAGVGTSTLVAEAMDLLRELYPDVALVRARGAPGLRRALGAHLGVLEPHGIERLAAAIGTSRLLVVADPPEGTGPQVMVAERQLAREVDRLVDRCAGLAVVVVTQHPGPWPGAQHVAVHPLPVPAPHLSPDALRDEPAVALLLERVATADASLEPTDEVVLAAGEVCRVVGGLPLALELVAALAASIGLTTVADLLRGGPTRVALLSTRRAEPHGVRTALELSYAALDPDAAQLLREASTLRGPFDLAAARAVSGLPASRLVDALDVLVDLRLAEYAGPATPVFPRLAQLRAEPGSGPRYALGHAAADLGAELLEHGGERERVLDRHAAHFAALARVAAAAAADAREDVAHSMLAPAAADLASAVSRVRSGPDLEAALRLVVDLPLLSRSVGERENLLAVVDDLLEELADQPVDEGLLADTEIWSAALALDRADASHHVEDALPLLLSGVDRARATGDPLRLLHGLAVVASTLPLHGNRVLAYRSVDEGLALAASVGHERWLARFEAARARLLLDDGDVAGAVHVGLAALRRGRAAADPQAMVAAGVLLRAAPRAAFRQAAELDEAPGLEDLLGLLDGLGEVADQGARSLVLGQLAADAAEAGDVQAAAGWVGARLELAWRQADWRGVAGSYLAASYLLTVAGEPVQAARLHGMARAVATPENPRVTRVDASGARAGSPDGRRPRSSAPTAPTFEDSETALRHVVGPDVFERAARAGAGLGAVSARAEAVEALGRLQAEAPADASGRDTDRGSPVPDGHLPDAEQELLDALVTGARLSDVARRSGRPPAEVASTAASLYRRLGVHGHAEAVARTSRLLPH